MSKTIDEKVVEMRFDNKNFEANVGTTLSTLDKLKAKLNFPGASKALDGINNAAKKVNLDGITTAVTTIYSKFSALETIGVGALLKIGSAAASAGKNIIESMSGIKAAMDGFDEYSMTMNTVQTLVNSTGKSIKEVEGQLKDLDDYADKTVYSTKDMFENIYKFTNAGIDLDTAKTAMIGIANATAYAGQGAAQASIAYYNLAQSMSTGYLTTIDYKSLNLANIATNEFKQRLADAAIAAGKLKKVGDDVYSTGKKTYSLQTLFTEGLKDQWASTNVMMDVFKQYGSTQTEIGKKAWAAAQEVKTFGMMVESLSAQAGTGWKDTWQILFGGLDDAKRVWTGLSNFIGKIIGGVARWRNTILDIAMNNPVKNMFDQIKNVTEKIKPFTKSLGEYQEMVQKIWKGDFKNQPYRKALVEATGYNYEVTQSLVNLTAKMDKYGEGWKAIGKITEEHITEAEKKFGVATQKTTEQLEAEKHVLENLTDEKLKQAGLNEDEIYTYRQLEKGAKKYGISIEDLISKMDKASGRDLLYGSKDGQIIGVFQNIGDSITHVFDAIKKGWSDVFVGITGVDLYVFIDKLNSFTASIRKFTENSKEMNKVTDTFRGLFSILHIFTSAIGGGFKIVLNVIKGVLGAFNMNILDFTSLVGNMIYRFDQWLTKNNIIIKGVKWLTEQIIKAYQATKEWIKSNEQIMLVVNMIRNAFSNAGNSIGAWFEGLKGSKNIAEYIFGGLINGIRENGPKVWNAIKEVALKLVDTVKNALGIHSPSKVMFAIGGFIIAGLVGGILSGKTSIQDVLTNIVEFIKGFFKNIDLGNIIAVGISAGIIFVVKKMIDLATMVLKPVMALTNLMNGLASALNSLSNVADSFADSLRYQGIASIIKSVGISIALLAVSLFILAKLPKEELQQGAIALGVLIGVLAAFVAVLVLMSKRLSKLKLPDMSKIVGVIISLSIGMLIMASALKKISTIRPEQMGPAIGGFIICVLALAGLIAVTAYLAKSMKGVDQVKIQSIGNLFLKLGFSMLIVAKALNMMRKVKDKDIQNMFITILGMVGILGAIAVINNFSGNSLMKSADTLKAVGATLLLLVIAMKIAGSLKPQDFLKGIAVIGVFSLLMLAMIGLSYIAGETVMIKVSATILIAALAIGALAMVMKLAGSLEPEEMKKGIKAVGWLSLFIGALIWVSRLSSSFHGLTLIGVAITIGVMGVIVFLLGQMDPEKARNGLIIVGILTLFMTRLLKAAQTFEPGEHAAKTLTTLAVILAIMSLSLLALSFIDIKKVLPAAVSLGLVILSLANVIRAINGLNVKKGTMSKLVMITLMAVAMAGIVAALSQIANPTGAVAIAGSVALLLLTCAGLLAIISKIKVNIKKVQQTVVALLLMTIPLLALAGVLAVMSNVNNSITNTLSLILLATAMTGLLFILANIAKLPTKDIIVGVLALTAMALPLLAFVGVLTAANGLDVASNTLNALFKMAIACTLLLIPLALIGSIITTGIGAVAIIAGILALTAMALPLLAFVGVLTLMKGITNATENINLLTTMMNVLTTCLVQLALVAPLAVLASVAILALVAVIGVIGVLVIAIGALVDKVPQIKEFIDKGMPILIALAEGIGKMLGSLVAGFLNVVTDELPHTAKKLSEFAIQLMPFIATMKLIDAKTKDGIKTLAESILILTAANLLNGITSFISGGDSFAKLGTQLSMFAIGATPFIMLMSQIKPEVMNGIKSLSEAILAITQGNLMNTISQFINGKNDLGSFGNALKPLAKAINEFISELGNFDQGKLSVVQVACDALKVISETANKLPKNGGLGAFFAGANDISSFGDKLPNLAKSVKGFINELSDGNNLSSDKIAIVNTACEVIKTISKVSTELPKSGGIGSFFGGDSDIVDFTGKLSKVAIGVRNFVNEIQANNTINGDTQGKIDVFKNILQSLISMNNNNLGNFTDNINSLADRIVPFGKKMNTFIKNVSEINQDSINNAKDKIMKMVELLNSLSLINPDLINNIGESIKNVATNAIKTFIDSLNSGNFSKQAQDIMIELVMNMLRGVESKRPDIIHVSSSVMTEAINAIKSVNTSEVYETGANFVIGFSNGINSKMSLVAEVGAAVGTKALEAAQHAIDSHSPSRETYKLGKFFDLGFINGIDALSGRVYDSSTEAGEQAKLGLRRAISGVASIISEGIDDELTIRPVLDLSNIKTGASSINSMFGKTSVGVANNLNAITTMKANRQNSDSNIVSAIEKLSNSMNSNAGNVYNINGITYDDGTNIQNAVSELVNAARIERRR